MISSPHVRDHPSRGERQAHRRDHQDPPVPKAGHQPRDPGTQSTRFVNDAECATDEEDQEDHVRAVGHSPGNGHERAEESDRRRLHHVVGPRYHDAPPGHRIFPALVLAGREQVGQRCTQQDAAREERDRVGKAKPSHPGAPVQIVPVSLMMAMTFPSESLKKAMDSS